MAPYSKRVEKTIGVLRRRGAEAFLVSKPENVRYLSGYSGEDAFLFITPKKRFLITDTRYILHAKKEVRGFEILMACGPLSGVICDLSARLKIKKVGIESSHLSFVACSRIKENIGAVELLPLTDTVEGLRQVKDAAEVGLIKDSVAILEKAVVYFESILKPGTSENDLAARTEYFIRAASGEWASFELIVASGPNSAFPHARPSDRIIRPNDMVLLDLGVSYRGYKSDLTRVFFLGKINAKHKKIYGIVKEAQERSIKAIKPGARIAAIDGVARGFINARGYQKNFGHSLGHGIGLEVHESPSISGRNHDSLRPGMVFTVEPAVYIPGWGGIRIEDMVLVTRRGCEVLTDDIDK